MRLSNRCGSVAAIQSGSARFNVLRVFIRVAVVLRAVQVAAKRHALCGSTARGFRGDRGPSAKVQRCDSSSEKHGFAQNSLPARPHPDSVQHTSSEWLEPVPGSFTTAAQPAARAHHLAQLSVHACARCARSRVHQQASGSIQQIQRATTDDAGGRLTGWRAGCLARCENHLAAATSPAASSAKVHPHRQE